MPLMCVVTQRSPPSMRRPPEQVVFLARTHWLMSIVIGGFMGALHLLLRNSAVLELNAKTYAITLGLASLYAIAGALVWWGAPGGRLLNHVCSVFYFVRPPLGSKIWAIMRSEEFRNHFRSLRE